MFLIKKHVLIKSRWGIMRKQLFMIIEGITQSKDATMAIGCPVVVDFVGFFSQ